MSPKEIDQDLISLQNYHSKHLRLAQDHAALLKENQRLEAALQQAIAAARLQDQQLLSLKAALEQLQSRVNERERVEERVKLLQQQKVKLRAEVETLTQLNRQGMARQRREERRGDWPEPPSPQESGELLPKVRRLEQQLLKKEARISALTQQRAVLERRLREAETALTAKGLQSSELQRTKDELEEARGELLRRRGEDRVLCRLLEQEPGVLLEQTAERLARQRY